MGLMTPLAVKIGSWPFMPKLLPQITASDKFLQRATRGKVSVLDLAGLPNLKLTVLGRKSGLPRETPLLAVPSGDKWLIAGSNFGMPKQPVWVINIEANPDCWITVGGVKSEVHARLLTGAERAEAWTVMMQTWPNYRLYEERTDREIKVFELSPRN